MQTVSIIKKELPVHKKSQWQQSFGARFLMIVNLLRINKMDDYFGRNLRWEIIIRESRNPNGSKALEQDL